MNISKTSYLREDQYVIQPLSHDRIDEVVALVNQSYWNQQQKYVVNGTVSLRTDYKEIEQLIQDPTKTLFLLKIKKTNALAGTVLFETTTDINTATAGLFAVDTALQGSGIGDILGNHLESYAKDAGKRIIKFEVLGLASKLLQHYEKHGYVKTGVKYPLTSVWNTELKPEYASCANAYYYEMSKKLTPSSL